MKGFMYILLCSDNSYYTGSTKHLWIRFHEHQNGKGANYTRKRLSVQLVFFEEYHRIDFAFKREKQVQKWRRAKKEALINGKPETLPVLAMNYTLRFMLEELRRLDEFGTLEDFLKGL